MSGSGRGGQGSAGRVRARAAAGFATIRHGDPAGTCWCRSAVSGGRSAPAGRPRWLHRVASARPARTPRARVARRVKGTGRRRQSGRQVGAWSSARSAAQRDHVDAAESGGVDLPAPKPPPARSALSSSPSPAGSPAPPAASPCTCPQPGRGSRPGSSSRPPRPIARRPRPHEAARPSDKTYGNSMSPPRPAPRHCAGAARAARGRTTRPATWGSSRLVD